MDPKKMLGQVKDYFKRKSTTEAERKANPTNIDTGIDTVLNRKKRQKKMLEDFNKELKGN